MKLRILAITTVLLIALTATAFAQATGGQQQGRPHPLIARIVKQLGLSQTQTQQIRDIVTKYYQDAVTIKKSSASDSDKRSQIKDLRTKAGDAIMAVLTPDQQTKATKMHLVELLLVPRSRVFAGLVIALSKVGLSDQQKSSIKGIMVDAQTDAKAIEDDTSLDRTAKQAKFVQLRQDTMTKIETVLTPDQQNQLKQLLAQERQGK